MFIKIAVQTVQPLTLVGFRLLFGLIATLVLVRINKEVFPRDRHILMQMIGIGIFNTALPFFLFTWAESGVDGVSSGIASLLNGTVPLFTIILAGVVFRTEGITGGKIAGLILGFIGMLIIFYPSLVGSSVQSVPKLLAPAGAAICYAGVSIYVKEKVKGVPPLILAAMTLFFADVIIWAFAFLTEDMTKNSFPFEAWFSLLWLGILGAGAAYALYFFIIQHWGATRTTMVTYLIPVVGVSAGVIFLSEPLTINILLGGVLILLGVYVVNSRGRLE